MLVVLLIKRSLGLESSNAGTLLPVVVSMIPSDFETASGEGDRNQPQYEGTASIKDKDVKSMDRLPDEMAEQRRAAWQ
jgi:hypothetical protein